MPSKPQRPHRHLAILLTAGVCLMVGLAYASVPLYRIFCQQTGFGGTPKIAVGSTSSQILDRRVTVHFEATVHRDLPWHFKPLQQRQSVRIGEEGLAFYEAINFSDRPIVGMATYNVTPDKAAPYFNKIACFCFERQTLAPHQRMPMPVQFFIDPAFAKDHNLDDIHTITLSYTFFELQDAKNR